MPLQHVTTDTTAQSVESVHEPVKKKKSSNQRRASESDGTRPRTSHQQQRTVLRTGERTPVVDFMGDEESSSEDDNDGSSDEDFDGARATRARDSGQAADRGIRLHGEDVGADKWRRRSRIIESDSEDSGANYVSEAQQPLPERLLPQKRRSHSQNNHRTRVRSMKKRRYVGGYFHSGDDVDATFIQPEDNANALPDDVARGIGFKLGKSKAELKAQLATIAGQLTTNLREFKDQKDLISQRNKRVSAMPADELEDFYRQVLTKCTLLLRSGR